MRVALLTDVAKMEVGHRTLPTATGSDIQIRVRACALCGSDLHYFTHGGLGSHKAHLPLCLGHEVAGTVEYSYSERFTPGQRVAVEPNGFCGECDMCRSARFNLCRSPAFLGSMDTYGALREFIEVREDQVFPIPDSLSFEEAAMLEPFAVALHAVNRAGVCVGEGVNVFGAGAIGQCIALAAKLAGAAWVSLCDPLAYRVTMCQTLGAGDEAVTQPTLHADVCFDAAGTQASLDDAVRTAKVGGRVVVVGIPVVDQLTYNPHQARVKELDLIHTRRSNRTFAAARDLVAAGRVSLKRLVTHTCGLGDVQAAFETAAGYRDGVLRYVVDPSR